MSELKLLAAVGTVAHNRAFTMRDLAEQARMPMKTTRQIVKRWQRTGMIEIAGVAPVSYAPTVTLWERIEALVGHELED